MINFPFPHIPSTRIQFTFTAINDRARQTIQVYNGHATDAHHITAVRFSTSNVSQQVRLVSPTANHRFTIQPGHSVDYVFEAHAKIFGRCTENVTFQFARNIAIMRHIHLELNDPTGATPSIGTGANTYRNKTYTHGVWSRKFDSIVPGVNLNERINFVSRHLGTWDVPKDLRSAVLAPHTSIEIDQLLAVQLPFLGASLTYRTYEKSMHALLHLEEIQQFHNMRRYDRSRAHFQRERDYLALHVPNMAEQRPSLVLGDYVLAFSPWEASTASDGRKRTQEDLKVGSIGRTLFGGRFRYSF